MRYLPAVFFGNRCLFIAIFMSGRWPFATPVFFNGWLPNPILKVRPRKMERSWSFHFEVGPPLLWCKAVFLFKNPGKISRVIVPAIQGDGPYAVFRIPQQLFRLFEPDDTDKFIGGAPR